MTQRTRDGFIRNIPNSSVVDRIEKMYEILLDRHPDLERSLTIKMSGDRYQYINHRFIGGLPWIRGEADIIYDDLLAKDENDSKNAT